MAQPRALLCSAALCAALGLYAAPASSEPRSDELARRAFEDGVALEKQGDFAGALVHFRESMSLKATLGNRFHVAFCLESTGKLAAALDAYETVEALAKAQNKSDVLASTRERLDGLRTRVPKLAIRVVVTDAETRPVSVKVTLDEGEVEPTLLGGRPFRVDPGEHLIVARAAGHDDVARTMTAAEGSVTEVALVLAPTKAAPAATPSPLRHSEAPPPAPPPSRTLPILATAGAIALASGGALAFVLAGSAQSDAEASCPTKRSCDDERSQVRTLDGLALGGFIGGVALGALAAVLWVRRPSNANAASLSPLGGRF